MNEEYCWRRMVWSRAIWLSTGGRIRQLAEPVLIVLIFGWALALVLVPLLGA